jgi:hypothetical protein
LVPVLAFALASSQGAQGAAAASGMSLRWSDPGALAATTEADFAARLSERLGHPAFNPAETRYTLAVSWQGSPEQCRVELQLLREAEIEGTRRLESPSGDCRSLVPALLTVAALLIESRPSETEAEPASEPPKPAPTPPSAAPVPAPKPQPAQHAFAFLSLGAALSSGLAPRLELGPAASLVFVPVRQLRLGAAGSLFFPHQYGAAPGFSLGHDSLALLACGMPLSGSFSLGLCGNATWHSWSSRGISLPHPESQHSSEWTTGLAVRAEWRLARRLWWVGHVGADVTPRPLYFYFTPAPGGESILFSQQRIAPALFLGLTLELP